MAEKAYPNITIYSIKTPNGEYVEDIKSIQRQLSLYFKENAGIAPPASILSLQITGNFGSTTDLGVRDFQKFIKATKNPNFYIDGKVGPETWSYLFSDALGEIEINKPKRKIQGQVKNNLTKSPLSGVTVTYNFDPYNSGSVTTDKLGNFDIDINQEIYFFNRTLDSFEFPNEKLSEAIDGSILITKDSTAPPIVPSAGYFILDNEYKQWDAYVEFTPKDVNNSSLLTMTYTGNENRIINDTDYDREGRPSNPRQTIVAFSEIVYRTQGTILNTQPLKDYADTEYQFSYSVINNGKKFGFRAENPASLSENITNILTNNPEYKVSTILYGPKSPFKPSPSAPETSLNTSDVSTENLPSFIALAENLGDITQTPSYASLTSKDKTEILNHLRINFEYEKTYTNTEGVKEIKKWGVVPTGGGSQEIGFLPIEGISKNFKFNIGTIYLTPNNPPSSIEESQERVKLSESELEEINKKQNAINFLFGLLATLINFCKTKGLALLYKLIEQEFGISNPQQLIQTLKNYKQIIKDAEERGLNKQQKYDEAKQAILDSFNAIEKEEEVILTIPNPDVEINDQPTSYSSIVKRYYNKSNDIILNQNDTISIEEALNKLPIPNPPKLPNPNNIPKKKKETKNTKNEDVETNTNTYEYQAKNNESINQSIENNKAKLEDTKNLTKNIRATSVDKELLSGTAQQLAILVSFGIIPPFKPKCPAPKRLEQIIKLRNGLTTQLNNFSKTINTVRKTVRTLTTTISTLQDAKNAIILAASLNPAPLATVTAGVVSGLEFAKSKGINKLDNELTKITSKINVIDPYIIIALSNIEKILSLMSLLDTLIRDCAVDSQIPLTQVDKAITESIVEQASRRNGSNPIQTEYNGFKLNVAEENSTSSYKRRYAQAIDTQGVVQLRSLPSFSSNDQILINELIFEIESKNLKAD
tara:strand:+ start:1367 stop:4165 length:2799 start_codon:yes stop_codon:yes gene_type:complete